MKMKAVQAYGPNPEDIGLREVEVPQVGKDDVLIKIKATAICGSDLVWVRGLGKPELQKPRIIGHEFAGVVAQVGEEVKDWAPGDRIVSDNTGGVCGRCYACATGDFLNCSSRKGLGSKLDGGFAEYVLISGDILKINPYCVHKIPDTVSFEEASIMDPICNAYKAVVQQSHLVPGEDAVFYGPGPLGLFGVQFARLMGCRNIIVVGTKYDKKLRLEMARQFGATHILISGQDDVPAGIESICGGRYEIGTIFDFAGPASITEEAIKLLRKGGEIIRVGVHHGDMNEAGEFGTMVLRELTVQGHYGYNYISWRNSLRLLERGMIDAKTQITHTLPLKDWKKGMELMASQEAVKVVMNPEW